MLFFAQIQPGICYAKSAEEYAVKAAFVFNFIKFTQWPDNRFTETAREFRICFFGDDEVARNFSALNGKMYGRNRISVSRRNSGQSCTDCDLIFISRGTDPDLVEQVLQQSVDRPVLTIGESDTFARDGGVINFIRKNDRLQFEINTRTARDKGFKLSSRLLKLANIVE